MPEGPPKPASSELVSPELTRPVEAVEQKVEHIPTPDEVHEVLQRMIPGEHHETKRLVDDEGHLFRLDTLAKGAEEGETAELVYMRKGRYPNGDSAAETEIHSVLYAKDGSYNGAGPQASFVDGKWVVIE